MAKQTIGVGSAANDGTGDDLRTGGQKINANFTELYGKPKTVYHDPVNGNDSNTGLTLDSPLATMAAVKAALSRGDTWSIARGARIFTPLQAFDWSDDIKMTSYGVGPKPIFDTSRVVTATVTAEGSPGVYTFTQTHEYTAKGSSSPSLASKMHFMVWVEREAGRTRRLTRYDATSGTIADAIAYVEANPGTFFCHLSGSTNPNPRTDADGTEYVYYIHLHNSEDPTAAGTSLFYAEYLKGFVIGDGWSMDGIVVQRNGEKDLAGNNDNASELIENCEFYDGGTHAFVGPVNHRNTIAVGGQDALTTGGGGIHWYFTDTSGSAKSVLAEFCIADGYNKNYYAHGAGGGSQYVSATIRDCVARNGQWAINGPQTDKGFFVERFISYKNQILLTADGPYAELKDFWHKASAHESAGQAYMIFDYADHMYLENGMLWNPTESLYALFDGQGINNLLSLKNVTLINIGMANSAGKLEQALDIEDSIFGELPASTSDVRRVANSYVTYSQMTLSEIQGVWPNVENDCVSPWVEQTFEFTAVESDILEVSIPRNAEGTSGSAVIDVGNDSGFVVGNAVRIKDYDGAGNDFDSYIVSIDGAANTLTLGDALDATFSSKSCVLLIYNRPVFPVDVGTCVRSSNGDGTAVVFSQPEDLAAGMLIRLGDPQPQGTYKGGTIPGGLFEIVTFDRATGAATLDKPISGAFHDFSGMSYGTSSRPAYPVSLGFPLRTINGTLSLDGPTLSFTHPGGTETVQTERTAFDWLVSNGRLFDGTQTGGSSPPEINHANGVIEGAIPILPGTQISVSAVAHIRELSNVDMGIPTQRDGTPLPVDHELMKRGMGARAW